MPKPTTEALRAAVNECATHTTTFRVAAVRLWTCDFLPGAHTNGLRNQEVTDIPADITDHHAAIVMSCVSHHVFRGHPSVPWEVIARAPRINRAGGPA